MAAAAARRQRAQQHQRQQAPDRVPRSAAWEEVTHGRSAEKG